MKLEHEPIKVHDGEDLFYHWKEWIKSLEKETDQLSRSFDKFKSIGFKFNHAELIKLQNSEGTYFENLEHTVYKKIDNENSILEDVMFENADKQISAARVAYQNWRAEYVKYNGISDQGYRVPHILCELPSLECLFSGVTDEWLNSKRPLFDTFITEIEDIEYYRALEAFTQSLNTIIGYTDRWEVAEAPTRYFVEYDTDLKKYRPNLNFIKFMTPFAVFEPEPIPEPIDNTKTKEHAKHSLQLIYQRRNPHNDKPISDDKLLAMAPNNGLEWEQSNTKLKELQAQLKNGL